MPAPIPPSTALNPYHPPSAAESYRLREWLTSRARFTVEADRCYDVSVEFNHWSGLELYCVQGIERRVVDNKWPWLHQQILLNDQPRTLLEFRSWFFPIFPVRVLVNGQTYARNLFPGFLRNLVVCSFVAGLVVGLLYVFLDPPSWWS